MFDRDWAARLLRMVATRPRPLRDGRRGRRPAIEGLEGRALLATLDPIPTVTVPTGVGIQIPLQGGSGGSQTFRASSDNASLRANIAQGQFLTIGVTHASSGLGDPAFSGNLVFKLFEDLTPITTSRIKSLVTQGFYTSPTSGATGVNLPTKNFHRVAPGFPGAAFIVQGGSVNGDGTGEVNQPGFPFDDEFVQQLVFTGVGQLAMANAGDDTNGSQFFATTGSPRFLDFQHTIFAQLTDGAEILNLMTQVSRNADNTPLSPILFTSTTLADGSPDGVVYIDATSAGAGSTANVTVTATDPADGSTATQTFAVNVIANSVNERPFLNPVANQFVGPNRVARFAVSATTANEGDVLTFGIGGGRAANGTFAPVQNATASVDSLGNVTVTPNAGFTGVINLLIGVRNQFDRTGTGNLNLVDNFDTQAITLTVTTNNPPVARPIDATATQNVPVTIQLAGDSGNPGTNQTIVFAIASQPANGTLSGFDANLGTVVYTPAPNFVGNDSFTYTVRDVGEPQPNLTSPPATVSIKVNPGTPINVRPSALPGNASVDVNTPTVVQLQGNTNNPESNQTLQFTILTQPLFGTITDFDPNTGAFVYTPIADFVGTDTLTFRVRDVGDPTPNLDSDPATFTLTVAGAVNTGAVRQVGRVLVVTPPPRRLRDRTPNTINVNLIGGRISVSVNGQVDALRTLESELDRIVVYGAKVGDAIRVSESVTLPTTLDGGHGGRNTVQAGGGPSRLHGWFGFNTLTGGPATDQLIGRQGHVRFRGSPGNDLYYAADPQLAPSTRHGRPVPPTGQFFRFVRNRFVPVPTPRPFVSGMIIEREPR